MMSTMTDTIHSQVKRSRQDNVPLDEETQERQKRVKLASSEAEY